MNEKLEDANISRALDQKFADDIESLRGALNQCVKAARAHGLRVDLKVDDTVYDCNNVLPRSTVEAQVYRPVKPETRRPRETDQAYAQRLHDESVAANTTYPPMSCGLGHRTRYEALKAEGASFYHTDDGRRLRARLHTGAEFQSESELKMSDAPSGIGGTHFDVKILHDTSILETLVFVRIR